MGSSNWKVFAFTLVLILLAAAPVLAQETATPAMSVCQARRTIVTQIQRVNIEYYGNRLESIPTDIEVDLREIKLQAGPGHACNKYYPRSVYEIDLQKLGVVTAVLGDLGKNGGLESFLRMDGRDLIDCRKYMPSTGILGFISWWSDDKGETGYRNAQAFSDAMNSLRLYARTYDPSRGLPPVCFADKDEQARIWAGFQQRAAAWRALPARPPLSEAVRKQQLLAEDAVNQKQFEAADAAYDAGTEIDPLWPEGHFNAAAIYGELKDYDDAIWHMRCYLELLPNARDAQAARDQMLLWQAKAEQAAAVK